MSVRIREMAPDDCAAVAVVRVRGWQAAYTGLMPQAHLDAMSVEKSTERHRANLLNAGPGVLHLVAERGGTVVGWGCLGPGRDEDAQAADGEVYALYVHPGHWSTGAGRALMDALVARAGLGGFRVLRLWVLEGNDRARRFYAKAGFAVDGVAEPFDVDGVPVPEVRYAMRLSAADAAAARRG